MKKIRKSRSKKDLLKPYEVSVYQRQDLRAVLKDILKGDLTWEEKDISLDDNERLEYAKAAQFIIESSVWQNEINKMKDTFIKSMATTVDTYEQLRDIRVTLNAIQYLEDRFKEIANWVGRSQNNEDKFAGV